jgi:DNA-binding MarR family transcriptional regulator
MDFSSVLVGFGAGAGLTVAGFGVWQLVRRWRSDASIEPESGPFTTVESTRSDGGGSRPPVAGSTVPPLHGEPTIEAAVPSPAGWGPTSAGPTPPSPGGPTDPRNGALAGRAAPVPEPVRVKRDVLRLSHRVVLHIAQQGFLPPNEVAPLGLSQTGMVADLGATQSSLTKVLQRLEAAGVLTVGRAHVRGQPRRLKVYRLTPLGESLARELRSQAAAARRRNGADSANSIYR